MLTLARQSMSVDGRLNHVASGNATTYLKVPAVCECTPIEVWSVTRTMYA